MANIGELIKKQQAEAEKRQAYFQSAYTGHSSTAKSTTPTQVYEEATQVAPSDDLRVRWAKANEWDRANASGVQDSKAAQAINSAIDRAANILKSAGTGTAAGYASTLGTTQAVTGGTIRRNYLNTDIQRLENELTTYRIKARNADNVEEQKYFLLEAGKTANALEAAKQNLKETETAGQAMQQTADRLSQTSAESAAKAKEGLGGVGSTLVDAAIAGTQMLGDAALGGNASLALRSFGNASMQAREKEGTTLGQQVAYGVGSAAVQTALGKLANFSGIFKEAYGTGILDTAFARITAKPAGRLVASALSEGFEEFGEDAADVVLQRLTYNPEEAYDAEWLANAFYDATIGAILGGVGAGVDIAADGLKPQEGTMPSTGTQMERETTAGKGGMENTVQSAAGGNSGPKVWHGETDTGAISPERMAEIIMNTGREASSENASFKLDTDTEVPIDSPEGRRQFPYTNRVLDDSLGSARGGYSTAGMEGREKTSRLAESMPYDKWQEGATALKKEDYAKLFRYKSQTEQKSLHLAEELLYYDIHNNDGTAKRVFLKDLDEEAFRELVSSLDEATAWNGPQTDAAYMIKAELEGRSANGEIEAEEYADFLRSFIEHTTAGGQGTQAHAKWSRTGNETGEASEREAWGNLKKSNLSDLEKAAVFQQVVKWDSDIETAKTTDDLKRIIMEIANRRGVVNGVMGKQFAKIAENALDSLSMEQLRQFAYRSSSAVTTDSTPANWGQKAKTIQVLNMLSNPKTAVKNILGNASFYGLDAVSMDGAALLDMALSNVTGTRSVATGGSSLSAAVKALQMSIAEITLDVDMSGSESRYGTGANRTFKASGSVPLFGSEFLGRVMSSLERNQAYLLTAPDEFTKGMARATETATQKLVDEGKIKNAGKDYAKEQAEQLAKYRTFQDNSDLSTALQSVRDLLNTSIFGIPLGTGDSGRRTGTGQVIHSFGVGDVVAPFTRVAGNIVVRSAEYSPINIAKGAVEIAQVVRAAAAGNLDPAKQAKAVSDTMRGVTGTTLAAGFMLLARAGLLRRADDEENANVAAMNQAEGMTGIQLNLPSRCMRSGCGYSVVETQ